MSFPPKETVRIILLPLKVSIGTPYHISMKAFIWAVGPPSVDGCSENPNLRSLHLLYYSGYVVINYA